MAKNLKEDRGKGKPPIFYAPGEVLLTIEHDQAEAAELVRQLQATALLKRDEIAGNRIDPQRVITIDRSLYGSRVYEGGVAQRSEPERSPRKSYFPKGAADKPQVATDDDLRPSGRRFISVVPIPIGVPDATHLPRLIDDMADEIDSLWRQELNGLVVRGISPNWFVDSAQNNTGGSGPGGRPTPVTRQITDIDYRFTLREMPQLDGAQATDEVDVIILDTAPSGEVLQQAYNDPNRSHALLRALLGPQSYGQGGALTVRHADDVATNLGLTPVQLPAGDHYIAHHDYAQPDHGLFVAGIIHTIAPKARIFLLEVLGEHGVGTVESIERGLLWALDHGRKHPGRPMIINCSLGLVLPPPWLTHSALADIWSLFARANRGQLRKFKLFSLPLEELCWYLAMPTAMVVAAAGNDGDGALESQGAERGAAGQRKDARYPAAYDTVLGVGALEEGNENPTSYSNTSDQPAGLGVATFGGEKLAPEPDSATKEEYGILGVYIGAFPDPPTANQNGWAWWAGTSFAAPIISGTLAALAGIRGSLEVARDELNSALIDPLPEGIGGVFPASQGPPPGAA